MGFKEENGVWYYYNEDGTKVISDWVKDDVGRWYYMDKDGIMVTGWFQTSHNDNHWFYAYKEQQEYNGNTRYKGEMATGWISENNRWFYLYPQETVNYGITYPEGAMAVDWVKLGEKNKWYYLLREKTEYNSDTHYKGEAVCSATIEINGQSYTFDKDGVMQSNASATGDSLVSDSLVEYVGGWELGAWCEEGANAMEDPYYPGDQRYWTIGYGTCYCAIPEAFPDGLDSTCTQEQALGWLKQEINLVAATIKSALGDSYSSMSQQAFDTLCDIGYNAGTGSLIGGNTWKAIISGDSDTITSKLMSWNKANGVVSAGLTKRCESRVNMCLNGVYDWSH